MLRQWYLEYKKNGDFSSGSRPRKRRSNYTDDQIKVAVDFYLEHGRNLNHTISSLGYPKSHNTLSQWVQRIAPSEITVCSWKNRKVTYSNEFKNAIVEELCLGDESAKQIIEKYGISGNSLYHWKSSILAKEYAVRKKSFNQEDVDSLKREASRLRKEVERLRLEKAVLEKAAEVLKKKRASVWTL